MASAGAQLKERDIFLRGQADRCRAQPEGGQGWQLVSRREGLAQGLIEGEPREFLFLPGRSVDQYFANSSAQANFLRRIRTRQ